MAHVRIEPLVSECRIFYEDNPGDHDPYQLTCNILWLHNEPGAVIISMHTAGQPHTRKTIWALVKALLDAGVTTVYATRADGHVLPRSVQLEDGRWKLDLLPYKDKLG